MGELIDLNQKNEMQEPLADDSHLNAFGLSEEDAQRLDPFGITALNSQYEAALGNIQHLLLEVGNTLTFQQSEVLTALVKFDTIKERLGYTNLSRAKFDTIAETSGVKRALGVVSAYNLAKAGSSRAARRMQLQRIANDNEELRPQVSVTAIQALHTMDKDEAQFKLAKDQIENKDSGGGVMFEFKLT